MRILVADDNVRHRRMVATYLRRAGYTVDEADNGVDAFAIMQARIPDAILLDIDMPEMDGPTLVAACRNDLRLAAVPVVVLSGAPTDESTASALGARAYLMKPIDLDMLQSILDRVTHA